MHLRTFSIAISLVILVTMSLMSLPRWIQWYLRQKELSWKISLHVLVVTATLIGLSISLLACSLSMDERGVEDEKDIEDEKGVEILLLSYGRVLIITQVSSDVKLVKVNADLT